MGHRRARVEITDSSCGTTGSGSASRANHRRSAALSGSTQPRLARPRRAGEEEVDPLVDRPAVAVRAVHPAQRHEVGGVDARCRAPRAPRGRPPRTPTRRPRRGRPRRPPSGRPCSRCSAAAAAAPRRRDAAARTPPGTTRNLSTMATTVAARSRKVGSAACSSRPACSRTRPSSCPRSRSQSPDWLVELRRHLPRRGGASHGRRRPGRGRRRRRRRPAPAGGTRRPAAAWRAYGVDVSFGGAGPPSCRCR